MAATDVVAIDFLRLWEIRPELPADEYKKKSRNNLTASRLEKV